MKTPSIQLSLAEARQITLQAQGLTSPATNNLSVLQNLGYVQIDTISVIERAHHHIFWTRNAKYRPHHLDQLIETRQAFEYWSHAASFLPMKDYCYSLPLKKYFSERKKNWSTAEKRLMKKVLTQIKAEGPLRSTDFDSPAGKKNGWWDWKPAKVALERLFHCGELEVAKRTGFQKVYDLPERVIPAATQTTSPTQQEYIRYLITRTLKHYGFATVPEIAYLQKSPMRTLIAHELRKMIEGGEVVSVEVEGLKSEKYFAIPELLEAKTTKKKVLHILSPFDNSVIQRRRLKNIFSFDYQIECYVPAKKRNFGYFCLPILYGTKFVGRLDPKADRHNGKFLIKSLHLEQGVSQDEVQEPLEKKLEAFAEFNGCELSWR